MPVLTETMPYSKASATRQTRAISLARNTRQPKDRVIGHGHNFIFGFKFKQWRDRTKSFFGEDHHIGGHAGQHGWLEEGFPNSWRPPPISTAPFATASPTWRSTFPSLAYQSAGLGDAIIGAIADFHLFDLGGQGGGKFIINPRLHKDAVGTNTCLARVTEF